MALVRRPAFNLADSYSYWEAQQELLRCVASWDAQSELATHNLVTTKSVITIYLVLEFKILLWVTFYVLEHGTILLGPQQNTNRKYSTLISHMAFRVWTSKERSVLLQTTNTGFLKISVRSYADVHFLSWKWKKYIRLRTPQGPGLFWVKMKASAWYGLRPNYCVFGW